jgi:hypothetical protein
MMVYATHCDSNYVTRVVALEKSLRLNGDTTPLYIIAHEVSTRMQIESLNLESTRVVELSELEGYFPELNRAKANRSKIEYIFCLTPFVVSYASIISDCSLVIYLDADLYFFAPPKLALEQIPSSATVSIIEHGFHSKFEHLNKYGKFNVGWMAFRIAKQGNSILEWWKTACITSTSTLVSDYVYADQKYLDEFPIRFPATHINQRQGLNIAPWNIENHLQGEKGSSNFGFELVFYHFSGLRVYGKITVLGLSGYSLRPTRKIKKKLYKVYVKSLIEAGDRLNLNPQVDSRRYSFREILKILYCRDFILNL